MNGRERYLRTLKFGKPDRPAVMHRTLPGAFAYHGRGLADLYRRYPTDAVRVSYKEKVSEEDGLFSDLIDDWGCVWESLSGDYQGRVVNRVFEDWSALESYRFPEPLYGLDKLERDVERIKSAGHQQFVVANIGHLWHRINYLRGFENSLLDVMDGSQELLYLTERVTDILVKRIEKLGEYREHIDAVEINDDWGTQQTLMIKPEYWRRIFKPAYKQMVDAAHASGLLVTMHSDGVIREIVPDLIEIGLDEVNPQVFCMDVEELGREFGGKICFRADLDRQYVLPWGTPAEVEAQVRRAFETFGRYDGGWVGYGQIGTDVPLANAEAMLATFFKLRYEG